MATSEKKYTRVNFDQVVSDISQILKSKEGALADLGESSYGRTLIELFAANSDLMATWAESSFQNSFLETAFTREAVYVGARSIGYSIRRPIPAKAGFGISLKRTGIYPTVRVVVPKGTTFNSVGVTLTAMEDCEFAYDRTQPDFEAGVLKLVSGTAVLVEGRFNTQEFFADGKQNQQYIIGDAGFSDFFGINDPAYDESQSPVLRKTSFTTVTTDSSLVSNYDPLIAQGGLIWWRVSRRGFQDPTLNTNINPLANGTSNNISNNYSVVINTGNDGRAFVQFSDGINAAIPSGNITVKYFSTSGELGNRMNVAGSMMNLDTTNILVTQSDGTQSDLGIPDLNFGLVTDINGGLNTESIESVKQNAPQVFNSLDSLGNRSSYNTYLRRISDIRYSNVYGEDVLARTSPNYRVNVKYSNIVRFSVLKDLYRVVGGKIYPTDPFEYYVSGYKVNGLVYLWQYDFTTLPSEQQVNLLGAQLNTIKQNLINSGVTITVPDSSVVTGVSEMPIDTFMATYLYPETPVPTIPSAVFNANLTPLDFVVAGSELYTILKSLNRKGYVTLGGGQSMYEPPIVHDMTASINVILFEGQSFSDIKQNIKNGIYAYLRENTEFATTLYRSNLECIIQDFPEVAGVNLVFKAKPNQYIGFNIDNILWLGDSTAQLINQTGIDFVGFQASLQFSSKELMGDGLYSNVPHTIIFDVGNQSKIQSDILNYYKGVIARYSESTGQYMVRSDLSEQMLNQFTTFIWVSMLNEIYTPLYNLYLDARSQGDVERANYTYEVMNAIKNWYFDGTTIAFTDTDTIKNMVEVGGLSIFNYFSYAFEYIKLVRNILGYVTAGRLIDAQGNISKYTSNNEIVQLNISNEDIKIDVRSR